MAFYLLSEDKKEKLESYGYFQDKHSANNAKAYLEGLTGRKTYTIAEHEEKQANVPVYKNAGEFISEHMNEDSM